MSRQVYINGESMVYVKGPAGSLIANLTELGLAQNQVVITLMAHHDEIMADAWGKAPFDIQTKLARVNVSMDLIHFDRLILEECNRLSMGGGNAIGRIGRAGTLLGGGVAVGQTGNNFIRLNIASPVGQVPWRFFASYIPGGTPQFPVGAEKTVAQMQWTCIPYTTDPWQGGSGAANFPLFDHVLDS